MERRKDHSRHATTNLRTLLGLLSTLYFLVVLFKVDSPGIAPGSPVCRTGIFLLDDEPDSHLAVSGSRGTRTHKRVSPATCFQDRSLIPAG